jgi:hypothetical protein
VLLAVSSDNQTFIVANPLGRDNQQDSNGNYGPMTVLTQADWNSVATSCAP